jgi:hypothetical protein
MMPKSQFATFHARLLDSGRETIYLSMKARKEGAPGAAMAKSARLLPVLRRTMNDVTDGLLLDVREISITDLEFTDEGSALNRALKRILVSGTESNFNSFGSSI